MQSPVPTIGKNQPKESHRGCLLLQWCITLRHHQQHWNYGGLHLSRKSEFEQFQLQLTQHQLRPALISDVSTEMAFGMGGPAVDGPTAPQLRSPIGSEGNSVIMDVVEVRMFGQT